MSAVGDAFDTDSQTDIISYTALLAAVLTVAIYTDVLGASGGQIAILPGTNYEIVVAEYLLFIFGASVVVGYMYNGQSIDDLEVVDGILGVVGAALPILWYYVPQIQSYVPSEYQTLASVGVAVLGLYAIYIWMFGDEGGIIG